MFDMDPLISIAVLLAAALVGGMVAHRLRQPIILGYIVIGTIVGPHALGLVKDLELIETAATMGVTLLMFALGLGISPAQLREVGKVGIWGGLVQIMATLALGTVVGIGIFHWSTTQSILLGLIISLSSTAVCLKVLMDGGELSSVHGRIMIAMLILQDISVVPMMVIMPLIGGAEENLAIAIAMAAGKAVLFIGIGILLGRWVLPWLLGNVGRVEARELFLLTILVLCLGATIGTYFFGLSMVFGAFLVGLILRSTRFAHQALAEITPLRDIFATLFFVSIGMLLDPQFLLTNWPFILLLAGIILLIKLTVVFCTVRWFGFSNRIALLTGVGLFQLGEFGFVLAQDGLNMNIISEQFYALVLSVTIITMLLTPVLLSLVSRLLLRRGLAQKGRGLSMEGACNSDTAGDGAVPLNRVVIAGYGRVGQNLVRSLEDASIPCVVIDIDPERVAELKSSGISRVYGDATNLQVLSQADLCNAMALVITYPDPLAVITTAKIALSLNPNIKILARFHRSKEAEALKKLGVAGLVNPEYEASFKLFKQILKLSGIDKAARQQVLDMAREDDGVA